MLLIYSYLPVHRCFESSHHLEYGLFGESKGPLSPISSYRCCVHHQNTQDSHYAKERGFGEVLVYLISYLSG